MNRAIFLLTVTMAFAPIHAQVPMEKPMFRNGVDANYWLYLATETYDSADWSDVAWKSGDTPQKWYDREQEIDPFDFLHEKGVDAFRVRLWVSEDGPSGLKYATERAHKAQKSGLKPYLVIFLSDRWADFTKQPRPKRWGELDPEALKQTVRRYCHDVVRHFQNEGIQLDMYAIGNETDLGICGAFPSSIQDVSDAERIKAWTESAEIIKAAIAGVKSAAPDGKIMLHIAMTWVYDFARGYFGFISQQGVAFDYMGLSYYPSSPAMREMRTIEAIDAFVNRLYDQFKRPIIIAEYAFPHTADFTHAIFKDWNLPVYGYEPTTQGQKQMLSTFLNWARAHPHVYGVYYWSPEWYIPGEPHVEAGWGPMCLFGPDGRALPAVESFWKTEPGRY
ncbi:glycosyl hydrolase 53 family protein [Candidatus Poribacteria bacterium]|nr:glycosyl hydrolase 53 family protein [Candidatus Poribacteria bacterium]